MSKASKTTVNLDTAARLDIICRKGDTFTLALEFGKTMPTDGWALDVRESDTATGTVLENTDFTYTVTDGKETNSKLTVQGAATTMAAIDSGLFVYDLQNTDSSTVKTYLYGTFKVNEDVTLV
jgi:hypothetical protein|tara:strand:- start:503 stop:871 length:369 start_codon:yes stop_codon:yes gene_type:complete